MSRCLLLFVLLALVGTLPAQTTSLNISSLGQVPFGVGTSAEVRSHDDLVAVARRGEGFSLVDCSDPTQPNELFSGRNDLFVQDLWLDGTRLICANESGNGQAIYVFDISNPAAPVELGSHGSFQSLIVANNLAVHQGTHAFCASTIFNQVVILDVSNPAAISEVGTLSSNSPLGQIHDLAVVDDRLYVSWLSGGFEVYDLSGNPAAPSLVLAHAEPTSLVHNTWPLDANTLVTSDEVSGGYLRVWDVSNPAAISLVSQWRASPMAVMHNVMVVDQLAFVSNYSAGLRVVDLRHPALPVEVAFFDPFSGTNPFTFGMWGVEARDATRLYGADFNSGLHVLDLELITTGLSTGQSAYNWGDTIQLSLDLGNPTIKNLPVDLLLAVGTPGTPVDSLLPILTAPLVVPAGLNLTSLPLGLATPSGPGPAWTLELRFIATSAGGALIHADSSATITLQ